MSYPQNGGMYFQIQEQERRYREDQQRQFEESMRRNNQLFQEQQRAQQEQQRAYYQQLEEQRAASRRMEEDFQRSRQIYSTFSTRSHSTTTYSQPQSWSWGSGEPAWEFPEWLINLFWNGVICLGVCALIFFYFFGGILLDGWLSK